MSDINSFTVVLEKDITEDHAQHIKDSMMLVKGVLTVKANRSQYYDSVTELKTVTKIKGQLYDFIRNELGKEFLK